ncbi:MAG: preprotein translocase subunit SecG [Patescibacteria group bacterium]|nr:preprotein translocase subunit SecG [Patescibacteria group bacterium]
MFLVAVQLIVAIFLIGAILLQSQGSGLSSAFGQGGEFYRSRRSMEKLLVVMTIALAGVFALISIILLFPRG